jgi:hypothetical protein
MWRYCPYDLEPVSEPPRRLNYRYLSSDPSVEYAELARHWFLFAPQAYGGYLWLLTRIGQVFRLSPNRNELKPIENLEQRKGFGEYPFNFLGPLPPVAPAAGRRTLMAVLGRTQIAILDPAWHEQKPDEPAYSLPLEDGDFFLDSKRGFPAIAAVGNCIAALKCKADGTYLALFGCETCQAE